MEIFLIIFFLILSIILNIIMSILVKRQLNKIDFYEQNFIKYRNKITDAYAYLKQIDAIGAFESDDETGYIFNEIKSVVIDINACFEKENINIDEKNSNIKQ